MSETLSTLQTQEDTRVEDVDKAHEMALAGDRARTDAALGRSANTLVSGMIKEGYDVQELLPEVAFGGKAAFPAEQRAAEKAAWMMTPPSMEGRSRTPQDTADQLDAYGKVMDVVADHDEEAAGQRYDADRGNS